MRRLTFGAVLLVLAGLPVAEARQSTLNMTCGEARQVVASQGAVVLSTGQYTYDRFVASRRYCSIGEHTRPAWVPTRDGRCRIGFLCSHIDPLWSRGIGDFLRR